MIEQYDPAGDRGINRPQLAAQRLNAPSKQGVVANRGTGPGGGSKSKGKAIGAKKPAVAHVDRVERRVWNSARLYFDQLLLEHEVAQCLFNSKKAPAPFTIKARDDSAITTVWDLSWKGSLVDHYDALSEVGQSTMDRLIAAGISGEASEADLVAAEQDRVDRNKRNTEHNRTYVDALGMTGGQALDRLATGWFISKEMFVWKGVEDGRTVVKVWPVGSKQYKKDISELLDMGFTPREADREYVRMWNEIRFRIVLAFMGALGGAATLSGLNKPPPGAWGTADVAIATAGDVANTITQIKDLQASHDPELHSLGVATETSLRDALRAISVSDRATALTTGGRGEAVVKKVLESRGYLVVPLQNSSSQGIDFVAIKLTGPLAGVPIFIEVKTSLGDDAPRMTTDQQAMRNFIETRLKLAAERIGRYKNLDPQTAAAAALILEYLSAGNPIAAIHVSVTRLSARIKIAFKKWFNRPQSKPSKSVRPRRAR